MGSKPELRERGSLLSGWRSNSSRQIDVVAVGSGPKSVAEIRSVVRGLGTGAGDGPDFPVRDEYGQEMHSAMACLDDWGLPADRDNWSRAGRSSPDPSALPVRQRYHHILARVLRVSIACRDDERAEILSRFEDALIPFVWEMFGGPGHRVLWRMLPGHPGAQALLVVKALNAGGKRLWFDKTGFFFDELRTSLALNCKHMGLEASGGRRSDLLTDAEISKGTYRTRPGLHPLELSPQWSVVFGADADRRLAGNSGIKQRRKVIIGAGDTPLLSASDWARMFASCFADPLTAMDRLGWLLLTCRPGGRARVLWLFVHLPELFGDTLDGRPITIVLTRPVRRELSHLDPLRLVSTQPALPRNWEEISAGQKFGLTAKRLAARHRQVANTLRQLARVRQERWGSDDGLWRQLNKRADWLCEEADWIQIQGDNRHGIASATSGKWRALFRKFIGE